MSSELVIDPSLAVKLIQVFTQGRKQDLAMKCLIYARAQNAHHGLKLPINAYSEVISCCYSTENYLDGLKVFNVMRRDDYVPMEVTYGRAMLCARKLNKHDIVFEIYHDMRENGLSPSFIIYNHLLISCATTGKFTEATQVLEEMRENNVELSDISYDSLAIAAAKCGEVDAILEIWEEMEAVGKPITQCVYQSIIKAYVTKGQFPKAAKYGKMMIEKDFQLEDTSLGGVMLSFLRIKYPEKALSLFNDALKRNPDGVNVFCYHAAMDGYMKIHSYDNVFKVYEAMLESKHKPVSLTLLHLVRASVFKGEFEQALQYIRKFQSDGLNVLYNYRFLIRQCISKEKNLLASEISRELLTRYSKQARVEDWIIALRSSIKLPNKSKYWGFRFWVERKEIPLERIPKELLLNPSKSLLDGIVIKKTKVAKDANQTTAANSPPVAAVNGHGKVGQ